LEYTIVATGATTKGVEALRRGGEAAASVVSSQPNEGRKQITNVFATAEWACVEYDVYATVNGSLRVNDVEIIPKGASRTIQTQVCIVFHMGDGRFDRAWEYFDTGSMGRQLGVSAAVVANLYFVSRTWDRPIIH